MRRFLKKKSRKLVISLRVAAVSLAALLVFALLRNPLQDLLFLPLVAGRTIRNEFKSMVLYHFIMRENDSLRAQNDALMNKVIAVKGLELQNQRLNAILNFAAGTQLKLVPARVIAIDTSNLSSSITVDKGRNFGITVGRPVTTKLGLVGQVVEVTYTTSRILLINDPNLAVACRLLRSRDLGLVSGGLARNLKMQYLSGDADVAVNDIVVTAGIQVGHLKSVYPEGLALGVVVDVVDNPGIQTKTAFVKPFVDFSSIEEVLVIR